MTNGEKLKEIFPNIIKYGNILIDDTGVLQKNILFDDTWWNSEYKEPNKSENPNSSITKNDLGVEQDFVGVITEKISTQVTESHEEFIFETIRPYCENVVQMKISKRELERALLKYYGKNDSVVDCISRADVNQVIEDYMDEQYNVLSDRPRERANGANAVKARINELQPVTPQPRWIPVSEKLPEKTGWYLITFKVYGGGYAVNEMCYRKPENYWTRDDICKKILDNDEVIAWMPLPKPYELQESEG